MYVSAMQVDASKSQARFRFSPQDRRLSFALGCENVSGTANLTLEFSHKFAVQCSPFEICGNVQTHYRSVFFRQVIKQRLAGIGGKLPLIRIFFDEGKQFRGQVDRWFRTCHV